jgi:peptidase M1-like protein
VSRRGRRPLVAHVAIAAIVASVLAACTTTTAGRGTHSVPAPRTTGFPSNATPTTSAPDPCPGAYAAADPNRPKVTLVFTVAPDLTFVSGREHIRFTPDKPITELIFRLTANTAPTVAEGNRIVVTSAHADHGGLAPRYTLSGASQSTQGGLLDIPFPSTIAAGTTVSADIAFIVTLGAGSFDRFGRTGGFAWFGSAQPLLAWERGFGWHTEDMIKFTAESATSEAMDTDLTVTAPAKDDVVMSGDPTPPSAATTTRTWHATIAAARDVSVAVGTFAVADSVVDGVRLHLGAYDAAERDRLVLYGPFPFPSLSVARLPAQGGGIEYPSSILMLDGSREVAVHETSHQYFYAMVGDSQALHPWLDEAFAQYSEQQVDGSHEPVNALTASGAVDRSTESYNDDVNGYYYTTYDKGAAALEAAQEAVGPAAWDAALRCYVAANAWRIANPSDLQASLAKLPAAIAVLRKAGALP